MRKTNVKIPGPRPAPFLGWRGNVLNHFRNPIGNMTKLCRDHGDVTCLVQGGNHPIFLRPSSERTFSVFAFGADRNKEVLAQPNLFESDLLRGPEKCIWLSHNLVSANREDRAWQRRTIAPAFSRNHLENYYNDVVRLIEEIVAAWKIGETIDLVAEMEKYTANVASKIFYGQDPKDRHRNLALMAQEIAKAMFSITTMIPLNIPGTPYRRFLTFTENAERAVIQEIERRRSTRVLGDDALSIMIKAHDEGDGRRLSDSELVGNAFGLFLAGHKAPASGLACTIFLLSQNPDAMADLLDELDEHLGGNPPKFDEIWKLPVLDRVIREGMRVLSPGVIGWRRLTSTTNLGAYEIPGGSEILFSPYMTHINPSIYEDAKKFIPRRWETIKPSPFEYLPFSYGARKCLGATFGELLLKVVVAIVIQRFRLKVVPGSKIDFAVTFSLRPVPDIPMIVHKQDREFHDCKSRVRGQVVEMVDFT